MKDNDKTLPVGIERGKIIEANGSTYVVESFTRGGVQTREIEAVCQYVSECTCEGRTRYQYASGDEVFFFMFPDGRGMILGKTRR